MTTSLKIENLGPISCADVAFGDLTVLVGPQATGKSIFLQFLKLALDKGYIHDQLRKHGSVWEKNGVDFLDVYLGEGMCGIWRNNDNASRIVYNGKSLNMIQLSTPYHKKEPYKKSVFYIPAQRVLSFDIHGWIRTFEGFTNGDPFSIRDFSEVFRLFMQLELRNIVNLFPQPNRLKKEYRDLLSKHVFGNFRLRVSSRGAQKRLVLKNKKDDKPIPFMAWSSGQREFVPLLLGLYWLMPPAKIHRRDDLEWVVIEEPEMGLHPCAISVVLLLVMELLWRGYRVCLSTHSPHVLDVVWALRIIQQYKASEGRLLDIFDVRKTESMEKVAKAVIKKESKVYFFDRNGNTKDISNLDPGSEDVKEAGWGGLSEFSGRVADVVASVVND